MSTLLLRTASHYITCCWCKYSIVGVKHLCLISITAKIFKTLKWLWLHFKEKILTIIVGFYKCNITRIIHCTIYVGGIFNEQRHFKYVQMNVNLLECCRNGVFRLPTDAGIQCACARHRPQHCSGGISKWYLLKKHASYY